MKKTLTLAIVAQAAGALALLTVAAFEFMPGPAVAAMPGAAVAAQTVTSRKAEKASAADCDKATWPNIPAHCLDSRSDPNRKVSAVISIPNN